MKSYIFKTVLLLACIIYPMLSHSEDFICAARDDLTGKCFEVAGSLQLRNGTPSARIKKSDKINLAVTSLFTEDGETIAAPEAVRRQSSFSEPIKGKFLVCPLSKPQSGVIQSVCIEAMLKQDFSSTSKRHQE